MESYELIIAFMEHILRELRIEFLKLDQVTWFTQIVEADLFAPVGDF